MSDTTVTRQGFLRLTGALGGTLAAATALAPAAAAAAPTPRLVPRGSGGPLLDGSAFPIGVFWPPPPLQTTLERWQEMADAGFNLVHSNNYLFADWQIQVHALAIAEQVGIKVLVDDDDLRWITRNFRVSDDGGDFTLTRAEAETKLRQIVGRYAPSGYWSIDGGRLLISGGTGEGSIGWANEGTDWTDYTVAFTATPLPTGGGGMAQAGWAFRIADEHNAYVWLLNDNGGGQLTKAVFVNGTPSVTNVALPMTIEAGVAYDVETTVEGSTITTRVNGEVVDTTTDETYTTGSIGFREAGSESAWFDDVTVTAADGTTLFTEDFSGTLAAWNAPGAGGYASYAGLHVYDEPGVGQLGDLRTVLDILREIDPEGMPYVNQLPGFDYQAAVDQLDPEVLSFDRYPILAGGGTDGGYLANWAAVRAAALPAGIPTWVYIQSVGYNNHDVPNKDDLYWQINVSLAFGCTGIQYFTYWTPDPARGEGFHEALITVEGERTPLYDHATEINTTYLSRIGLELMPLTSTAVQGANFDDVPDGLDDVEADGEIARTKGDPVILGRFDGADGARYVLVVNYSRTERASVHLHWTKTVKRVATYDPGRERYKDRGRGELALRLGPGRATLVRVTVA